MKNPFDNIKLSRLHTLCNTLIDTQVRNFSNIRRKYLENDLEFDKTLSFLKDLKIVKNNSDELFSSISYSLRIDSIDEFKKKFVPLLFSATGEISEHLRNFLLNFQTENNKIFFSATEIEKIKYSSIRNLLLELEFITTSEDNSTYFVNYYYFDLFEKLFKREMLTPKALKRKQAENESIGFEAEKVIIEFEVNRLKNILLNRNEIEHTSQLNVLAGYDLKSFEKFLDSNKKRIYRYIEVKAVSIQDFKFYWSRTEMESAQVYGEKYFLYLLPVVTNNTFNLDKLRIVNNPYKNIYLNHQEWKKEEESISFSQKIDDYL